MLDDHFVADHLHGAARKRDGDDHRQEFGRQSDRQGDRKQQRFERVAPQRDVGQKHQQHQKHDRLQDQQAEAARAAVELGFRGRSTSRAAISPNRVAPPVATTIAVAVPLTTEVPM